MKKYEINVLCYKLHEPMILNKGTIHEKRLDIFLAHYAPADDKEAQALADKANAGKLNYKAYNLPTPDKATYFIDRQEPFDTRGD